MLRRELRCSWSSADRRCSNYIWVINNLIAYQGVPYIKDLAVNFLSTHTIFYSSKKRSYTYLNKWFCVFKSLSPHLYNNNNGWRIVLWTQREVVSSIPSSGCNITWWLWEEQPANNIDTNGLPTWQTLSNTVLSNSCKGTCTLYDMFNVTL